MKNKTFVSGASQDNLELLAIDNVTDSNNLFNARYKKFSANEDDFEIEGERKGGL